MGGKPARATDSRFRTTGVQATAQETRSAGGISAAQGLPTCFLHARIRFKSNFFLSLCSKARTRLPLRLGSTQTPPWDESPRAPPTVARITDPNWEGVQATAEETRSAGGISAVQDCPPASCMLRYASEYFPLAPAVHVFEC